MAYGVKETLNKLKVIQKRKNEQTEYGCELIKLKNIQSQQQTRTSHSMQAPFKRHITPYC